jgi:hypothetical protein
LGPAIEKRAQQLEKAEKAQERLMHLLTPHSKAGMCNSELDLLPAEFVGTRIPAVEAKKRIPVALGYPLKLNRVTKGA